MLELLKNVVQIVFSLLSISISCISKCNGSESDRSIWLLLLLESLSTSELSLLYSGGLAGVCWLAVGGREGGRVCWLEVCWLARAGREGGGVCWLLMAGIAVVPPSPTVMMFPIVQKTMLTPYTL